MRTLITQFKTSVVCMFLTLKTVYYLSSRQYQITKKVPNNLQLHKCRHSSRKEFMKTLNITSIKIQEITKARLLIIKSLRAIMKLRRMNSTSNQDIEALQSHQGQYSRYPYHITTPLKNRLEKRTTFQVRNRCKLSQVPRTKMIIEHRNPTNNL